MKQFVPKLQLNHTLPERLKLFPIEEDVFYILHFAFYAMEQRTSYCNTFMCYQSLISEWDEAIFDLSLGGKNHHQRALEIKENLCEKVLNCTAINILKTKDIPTWKDCHRNVTISMHQQWCKKCANLSECLKANSWVKMYFLQFIVNTFYTWRIYHNKRNIIDSSISTFLYHHNQVSVSKVSYDIRKEIPVYLKTFNIYPEHNLTLMDAWTYANLNLLMIKSFWMV